MIEAVVVSICFTSVAAAAFVAFIVLDGNPALAGSSAKFSKENLFRDCKKSFACSFNQAALQKH